MPERLPHLTPATECESIDEIRAAIDSIDHLIVDAIGKRFHYVQEITRFKSTSDDVRAVDRYQAVLQTRRTWAVEAGLDPDMIEEMYRNLIGHFINHELAVLNLPAAEHVEHDGA